MKKSNEKRKAFKLFKEDKYNFLEIAKQLNVTQKTVANWKMEYNAKQVKEQNIIDYLQAIQKELKEIKALIRQKGS